MYIPRHFKVDDHTAIINFIHENSFGILISQQEEFPSATHLPFLISRENNSFKLRSYMAKANTQWQSFNGSTPVLVIFSGPHCYVSPSWYQHPDVPTWNYQAIHVTGYVSILTGELQMKSLDDLVKKYESR